ncbi:conserved hypothetical protein [Candida tropicalis MYA-3404]|uniref:pyridoxal kinase n=1 Tax=Candida tropicalis (strain ATCC MYA-3404 / T1) TaxID=294747 RepID=C5M8Z0_CANTT|nr:conserved hypothetical protein [Candida tropicalis MYA-3404]EER34044.1 conserved hypothetical protein [Candida tropicalis MYA-3404]KAG4407904.1 hypothetical protein JTP64_003440 [Candida tropicalis]
MSDKEPMKALLSISSHVVHGYVGNRATVFPLQYTGWDVDAINTTNYSNHPGYGSLTGIATSPDLIQDIIQGLQKILNFKVTYDIILTGYTPNARVLTVVKDELIKSIQDKNQSSKKPHWVVDPVLGDNGKIYVDEKVIPVYKEIFSTGLVSLITPNQFEFETLCGVKINTWEDVKSAIEEFRNDYDIENIVISSVSINNKLYCVGSTKKSTFYIPINQIDCNFNGCGDLFTALMANEFYNYEYSINPEMLNDVSTKLNKILEFSFKDEIQQTGEEPSVVKDIRIVAAKEYLTIDYKSDNGVVYI